MLREFQTILNKNKDSMYKAGAAMKTGMGVVKDIGAKVAGLPAAETVDNIFFVDKARVPTGINCALGDMSDYHENFIDIAKDEPVTLTTPLFGERYGTDQYTKGGLVEEDRVSVGTDGKWMKSTIASRYVYGGEYNDAGNTLAIIEVTDFAATNA